MQKRLKSIIRNSCASALLAMPLAFGCSAEVSDDPMVDDGDLESQAATNPGEVLMENEASMNLLARVEIGSRVLRFYETTPGLIAVAESGIIATNPLLDESTKHMTAVQKYEYVTGEAAPQALIDAEQRVAVASEEAPAALESIADLDPTEGEPLANANFTRKAGGTWSNLTPEQWADYYLTSCGILDFSVCWGWAFGTGSRQWGDLNYFEVGALAIGGPMRMRARIRPFYTWSKYYDYNLLPGQEMHIEWYDGNLDFDGHAVFDQASDPGDQYHGYIMGEDGRAPW